MSTHSTPNNEGAHARPETPSAAAPGTRPLRYADAMRTGLLPTLILLPWAPIAPACASRAQVDVDVAPAAAATWEVRYSDGSGNRTWIWSGPAGAGWAYDPVQPHESSSGQYSGGASATGALTPDQAAEVLAGFAAAVESGEPPGDERRMGTGHVAIVRGEDVQEAVVTGPTGLQAVEALVTALRSW